MQNESYLGGDKGTSIHCQEEVLQKKAGSILLPPRKPHFTDFIDQLEYVRRVTGTQVIVRTPDDPKPVRGEHDSRHIFQEFTMYRVHRRLPSVRQDVCCVYETARRVYASPDTEVGQKEETEMLLESILHIGARAKDVSTFSKCTVPGGCGRYVCPECCGACPVGLCNDIQCKVYSSSQEYLNIDSHTHYRSASPTHGRPVIGASRAQKGQGRGEVGEWMAVFLVLLRFIFYTQSTQQRNIISARFHFSSTGEAHGRRGKV